MDKESEEVIALSDKISVLSAGYKNSVVMQATLNVCATAIVNGCNTREEADRASDAFAVRLAGAVRSYWTADHPH
jgi:hypothetical protein